MAGVIQNSWLFQCIFARYERAYTLQLSFYFKKLSRRYIFKNILVNDQL